MLSVINRLAASLALVCAALSLASASPALAQDNSNLTWRFHSNYPYTIHLEFYSRQYNRKWPAGEVYVINPHQGGYASLRCTYGEYICYGAWVAGNSATYWGVGRGGHQGCPRCCATCGHGEPTQITLDP
jgi:hypothetical protein